MFHSSGDVSRSASCSTPFTEFNFEEQTRYHNNTSYRRVICRTLLSSLLPTMPLMFFFPRLLASSRSAEQRDGLPCLRWTRKYKRNISMLLKREYLPYLGTIGIASKAAGDYNRHNIIRADSTRVPSVILQSLRKCTQRWIRQGGKKKKKLF